MQYTNDECFTCEGEAMTKPKLNWLKTSAKQPYYHATTPVGTLTVAAWGECANGNRYWPPGKSPVIWAVDGVPGGSIPRDAFASDPDVAMLHAERMLRDRLQAAMALFEGDSL